MSANSVDTDRKKRTAVSDVDLPVCPNTKDDYDCKVHVFVHVKKLVLSLYEGRYDVFI